jgi:cellulose synthase/poly-beta-1,6-N-acetylglucosamine synthase-like glycosyltransferase
MLNSNKNNSRGRIDYRSPMNDTQQYLDRMRDARHVKQESFGSQNINMNDYILSPEGWESFMFFIYFLAIPYLAGILFLFLFIAHANVTNFFVLNLSTFFIIWAIGYETIAALLLLSIFISYLNYLREPVQKHERR